MCSTLSIFKLKEEKLEELQDLNINIRTFVVVGVENLEIGDTSEIIYIIFTKEGVTTILKSIVDEFYIETKIE